MPYLNKYFLVFFYPNTQQSKMTDESIFIHKVILHPPPKKVTWHSQIKQDNYVNYGCKCVNLR